MSRRIPDTVRQAILADWIAGMRTPDICRKHSVSEDTVWKTARAHNVSKRSRRRHQLNEAAFDFAERSEAGAYYVGLLMADGSICHSGNGWNVVRLALKEGDVQQIRDFRDFLGSTHTIFVDRNENRYGRSPCHGLEVQSARLAAALARYGVLPQKTLREQVHVLEMNVDFWRGMVCGDGCVYISKGIPGIALVGSHKLVKQFLAFCRTLFDTDTQPTFPGHIWQVAFSGPRAYRLIEALFAHAAVGMERKMAKAKQILAEFAHLADVEPLPCSHHLTVREIESAFNATGDWKATAEALGVSLPGLFSMRKRLDMPIKKKKRTPTREQIQAAFEATGSWIGAAHELGIRVNSLNRIRRRLGMPTDARRSKWHKG